MNNKDKQEFEKWLYENKELRKTLENIKNNE